MVEHEDMRQRSPSWEHIETELDVETTSNRWEEAFVVKIPGTLRDWVHHLRRHMGIESSAMALGLSIPITDYALRAAEEGKGIATIGPDGPEAEITNSELRDLYHLPANVSPRWVKRKKV